MQCISILFTQYPVFLTTTESMLKYYLAFFHLQGEDLIHKKAVPTDKTVDIECGLVSGMFQAMYRTN